MMVKHELELRREIRKVLVEAGEGCDQPTPLEAALGKLAAVQGPDETDLSVVAPEDQSIGGLLMQMRRSSAAAEAAAPGAARPSAAGAATAVVPLAAVSEDAETGG